MVLVTCEQVVFLEDTFVFHLTGLAFSLQVSCPSPCDPHGYKSKICVLSVTHFFLCDKVLIKLVLAFRHYTGQPLCFSIAVTKGTPQVSTLARPKGPDRIRHQAAAATQSPLCGHVQYPLIKSRLFPWLSG